MSNVKTLLVALSTTRDDKRVRFAAGQTVKLTKDELETLDKLTVSTGALQYRDPVNESEAVDGTIVAERKFIGEDTAISQKNMEQLKAYLTYNEVEFADDAKKAALQSLAQEHSDAAVAAAKLDANADGSDENADDKDAGL